MFATANPTEAQLLESSAWAGSEGAFWPSPETGDHIGETVPPRATELNPNDALFGSL
jgi:hypothetical protein